MKPRRKPLVCVAVLDARKRRSASTAFQRRFHMGATEATQASKKKKPAHVGKRARANVKTAPVMTIRF